MQFQANNALTQALTIEGFIYGGSKNAHYNLSIQTGPKNCTYLTTTEKTTPEALLKALEKHGFAGKVEGIHVGTVVMINNRAMHDRAKELWVGQKTGFVFKS